MQIASLESIVIIPDNFEQEIKDVLVKKFPKSKIFITVDENTKKYCLPRLLAVAELADAHIIETQSGEDNKSVHTLVQIWDHLSQNGADRKALIINLGGGLLCDIGGFAAATFKRGINFINIPTTLLAQVDASVGGKLGINFNHLKNEVGLFKAPDFVFTESAFLETLDRDNLLSGFAEMIKHALIYSASHFTKLIQTDLNASVDYSKMRSLLSRSIFIKNEFVRNDPTEKNIRKALNFGHTIGHAIESFLIDRGTPELHGMAVAQGMICEAYLSHLHIGLAEAQLEQIVNYIKAYYPKAEYTTDDYETLYGLMTHDKKNEGKVINFTLIPEIGSVVINQDCTKDEVMQALEFYRTL